MFPPTCPLGDISHDLKGVFLQTKEEAMAYWCALLNVACTGVWLSSRSSVGPHCNGRHWKQREDLGCSWSLSVRPSFSLTSLIKGTTRERWHQFLLNVPWRVLFWRSSLPFPGSFHRAHCIPVTSRHLWPQLNRIINKRWEDPNFLIHALFDYFSGHAREVVVVVWKEEQLTKPSKMVWSQVSAGHRCYWPEKETQFFSSCSF